MGPLGCSNLDSDESSPGLGLGLGLERDGKTAADNLTLESPCATMLFGECLSSEDRA